MILDWRSFARSVLLFAIGKPMTSHLIWISVPARLYGQHSYAQRDLPVIVPVLKLRFIDEISAVRRPRNIFLKENHGRPCTIHWRIVGDQGRF